MMFDLLWPCVPEKRFRFYDCAFMKPAGSDDPERRHKHEQQREKEYDRQQIVRRCDDISIVIGEDDCSGR
jgi:hypothetical protein